MPPVFAHRRLTTAAALVALGLCAVPGSASAQFPQGPYIAGGFGWNLAPDTDLNLDQAAALGLGRAGYGAGGSVGFEPGIAGVLSLGWGFGNGLRLELEGNYRRNEVDSVSGAAGWASGGSPSGRQESWGVMGNALLDLGVFGPVIPYVGIGAGYVVTDWTGVRGIGQNGALRMRVDNSDGQFAYQGIAGLAFPVGFAPGLSFTAEYRYLATLQPRLQARFDNPTTGATVASGAVEPDVANHSLMLGLRYTLGRAATPAAPAPAAAPQASRTFLVFFDWNRADLTDRARQIITESVQHARSQRSTRIEVAGHADRSGTVQYNQALSRRRAETVAAELVRRGIAREEIAITAFGETQPLVATADDVREPQNRRVEIVVR
jgi:outer membrane protein OmpA-like peptidoglycan-associated protein